ncbi:MAG: SBBP repeat-containing protein [Pyrinomonadaceae bacterium]
MSTSRRPHFHLQLLRFVLSLALCQTFFVSPSTARSSASPFTHSRQPAKTTASETPPIPVSDEAQRARINASYGKLPLSFEANRGQTDARVKFTARGAGYGLFLTGDEALLNLHRRDPRINEEADGFEDVGNQNLTRVRRLAKRQLAPHRSIETIVKMNLIGANVAEVVGEDEQTGKSNYFIGHDPSKWRTDVARYGRVRYKEIYPGIDQIYYGNQGQLEYDFIVKPGADPQAIKMRFNGASGVKLNAQGELALQTADGGEVVQHKPIVYQMVAGEKRAIAGEYIIRENGEINFRIGNYDRTKPLVIDPILSYSTFLGGSNYDYIYDMAVDAAGNAIVTGYTGSNDFPVLNALQPASGGGTDVFITKLNASGTGLIFSTYLGGSDYEYGNAITLDAANNGYIGGYTHCQNVPQPSGAERA